MPISTWIRDIFGIRKDLIDTKKSKLEVKKLEEEDRARNLITPATMDDIKKYDPKYDQIHHAKGFYAKGSLGIIRRFVREYPGLVRIILLAIFIALLYRLLRWLIG